MCSTESKTRWIKSVSWVCFCLGFVMSRVCYVQCLLCLRFVMSRVCFVQGVLCLGFVMSKVCRVQGLSCLGFVVSWVCLSSVCLSRVGYCTNKSIYTQTIDKVQGLDMPLGYFNSTQVGCVCPLGISETINKFICNSHLFFLGRFVD